MNSHLERLLYGIAIVASATGAVALGFGLIEWVAVEGFAPLGLILTGLGVAYAVGWAVDPKR